ncbi:unnamed protein product [Timema podura]|uniref:Uncharacterized protein n=1 Tax=Timema podura TaxID=61482 RepID=A0ABN7NUL9_TIMPD|nr:unnamed protein product [Timema podura]
MIPILVASLSPWTRLQMMGRLEFDPGRIFTPSTGAHTNGTNTLGRDRKWCEGRLKPCLLQQVEAAYKLGV